jgi:hypothetical protein
LAITVPMPLGEHIAVFESWWAQRGLRAPDFVATVASSIARLAACGTHADFVLDVILLVTRHPFPHRINRMMEVMGLDPDGWRKLHDDLGELVPIWNHLVGLLRGVSFEAYPVWFQGPLLAMVGH